MFREDRIQPFRACRVRVTTPILLCLLFTAAATAQSTAPLAVDVGPSRVTVSLTVDVVTESFGTLSDTDSDTVAVEGAATLSLFPTDPPFTAATLQRMVLRPGDVELVLCLDTFCFIRVDVTVTDAEVTLLAPANGVIQSGGHTVFPSALLHTTGTAEFESSIFTFNEPVPIDLIGEADVDVVISEDGGTITLGNFVIPPVSGEVDPETLPEGVTSVMFDLDVDAGETTMSGAYSPATIGDADADGDIDLADYAVMNGCMTGPVATASIYCGLVDFDGDGNVDLMDFAEFQIAFGG
jgi:hypothetical protein